MNKFISTLGKHTVVFVVIELDIIQKFHHLLPSINPSPSARIYSLVGIIKNEDTKKVINPLLMGNQFTDHSRYKKKQLI